MMDPNGPFHLADREPVAQAIEAAAACETLDELYAAIRDYKGHEHAQNEPYTPSWPVSRDHGHPDGPLMIICEKPEAGDLGAPQPFTGQDYGWAMAEVLGWYGIDVRQMHTTFACHWTPPGDKPLNATMLSASRPFLFREIEIVKPRAILAPGRGVMESLFMYRDKLEDILGMTMDWKRSGMRIPVTCVWHPAFVARFKTQMGVYGDQVGNFFGRFGLPDGRPAPAKNIRHAA